MWMTGTTIPTTRSERPQRARRILLLAVFLGSTLAAARADETAAEACRRGERLLQVERVAEARGAFERAVELDPLSGRARYGLGVVRLREGRLEESRTELQRAVEIDPRHQRALRKLVPCPEILAQKLK